MQRTELRCLLVQARLCLVCVPLILFFFCAATPASSTEPTFEPKHFAADWQPPSWFKGEVISLSSQKTEATNQLVAHSESVPAKPLKPYEERPIGSLGIDIKRTAGQLPTNRAVEDQAFDNLASTVTHRAWPIMTRSWVASKTRHRPLYFEEVNAERYGYTCSRTLQPAISTAHFFGTIPMLPYLMAADGPCQCNYTLGHYRPGSCNPYRHHRWPRSIKGASVEAAVAVGLIALIP